MKKRFIIIIIALILIIAIVLVMKFLLKIDLMPIVKALFGIK